ncbi:MAG: ABC transporter permease [Acidobacteriota bacterium]
MLDWVALVRRQLDLPSMAGQRDDRMVRELADHLEDVYLEALERGRGEEQAMEQALEYLAEPGLMKKELLRSEPARRRAALNRWLADKERRTRGLGGGFIAVADLAGDARRSVRSICRRPVFSLLIVLVLAVGIGAATSIYTLLDQVVLSPLPFEDSGRLVSIDHSSRDLGIESAGQCAAWHLTYEAENRVFDSIGMYRTETSTVLGLGGEPLALPSLAVTSGLFEALRLQPVAGRLFGPADEALDAPSAILLSHAYWQQRFGGDPGALGETLHVDGQQRTIVGVVPRQIENLEFEPAIFYPLRWDRSRVYVGNIGAGGIARLRDGVSPQQAHDDMARMLDLAFETFPGGPLEGARFTPELEGLQETLLGSLSTLLWMSMAGVLAMLGVVCANVANLFLVRSADLNREMAVRSAIGAGRVQVMWEHVREALLLAAVGGALGILIAPLAQRALLADAPESLIRLRWVEPDARIYGLAFFFSLAAGLLFGGLPALSNLRISLADALRKSARGAIGRRQQRAQRFLVVGQIALALVLAIASGLMLRSLVSLQAVDPGFDASDRVLAFRLYVPPFRVSDADGVARRHQEIARRLEEIPGIDSVGLSSSIPMHVSSNVNPLWVEGQIYDESEAVPLRRHKWLGEGYLESLKIPLVQGRGFEDHELENRAPVALVSESLARLYWGSAEAALGQRVAARPEPVRWSVVVGVVADVREDGLVEAPPPMVYWTQATRGFWQGTPTDYIQTWRHMSYAIRGGRVEPIGLLEEIRAAVAEIDPTLPLLDIRQLGDLRQQSMGRTTFALQLLAVSAAVTLYLGLLGIYGVISYSVSRRTPEIGVRLALGARPSDVVSMILRQGLRLAGLGVALGLLLSLALTRSMSALLHGVSPQDPLTILTVLAALLATSSFATFLPALRASRTDPTEALRSD